MQPFEFDLTSRRYRFSDAEVLAGLRRFAQTVNYQTFRIREFNAWPERPFNAAIVQHRFGTWRAALAKIGVRASKAHLYTPAELIENLERVWRDLGRPPGAKQLALRGHITIGPYNRHWGSIKLARKRLADFHNGKISREDLLRPIPLSHRLPRRTIPTSLRWTILKRDNHRCATCGASPTSDPAVVLHIDHLIPVSKGGGNHESNLRVLCRACNAGKRDELPDSLPAAINTPVNQSDVDLQPPHPLTPSLVPGARSHSCA